MPNNNRLTKVILAIALLPMLVLSTQLFGQSASSIGGTVSDTSQAVLPNSTVTALNTATGISSTAVTNNAGNYNFPSLQPGTYKVTAEAKGFQTAIKTDVKLQMGNQLRLNFEMQISVGNTTIEVSTSAENMMLEAGSSTGTVLQEESVSQLPLASNDVMDLINIMGGVVKAENPIFSNSTQTFAGVQGGNINIQRDGISVNEVRYTSGIVSPIRINPDMVGEFKMVLSPVDAELGRGAGQVQILTKSGSNQFHGSGTWNIQNTALDAVEWENKKNKTQPDWRNLNDYTISVSGPIIKNKTFFFATWDQQIVRSKSTYKSQVLTPCAQKGIYRYLDNVTNGNTTAGVVAGTPANPWAAATPSSRPTVWGTGFKDATVISNTSGYDPTKVGFRPGDPLITYNGTLPAGFGSNTSNLEFESVLGQLTGAARTQILQDPYNCSAYTFDPLGTGTTGVTNPWDPTYRKAYDSSGYIKRFTTIMPAANDYSVGDGLNVADHAWTRELTGSDTVFGSGEDNERKSLTVKLDHNINNANRISGTYTYESDYGDDAYQTWPNGYGGSVVRKPQSFTVTLTSTLRPTLLNEARFGLSRTLTHTNDALNNPKNSSKMIALLQQLEPTSSFPNYGGQPLIIGPGGGTMQFATDTFSWAGGANASNPVGSRNNLPATWGGTDPRWSASDTVTWTHGAHSFKGGVELRLQNSNQDSNGAAGFVGSANTYPSIQGGILSTTPITANTFGGHAGFWSNMAGTDGGATQSNTGVYTATGTGNYPGVYSLLEYVTGSIGNIRQYFYVNDKTATVWNDAGKGQLQQKVDLSNKEFSFFFKDDWKVSSSLTLNLGMRWEYYGVPYSNNGMSAALAGGAQSLWRGGSGFKTWLTSLTAATPTPALSTDLAHYIFVGPNSPNPDKNPWNSDMNNFAPHVGFAWQLPWFGKGKTTLRGGYSVSYSPINNFDGYAGIIGKVPGANYQDNWYGGGGLPTYADMSTLSSIVPLVPASTIQPLLPRNDQTRSDYITVYDQNVRNPYVQSLNLSLTRNIGNALTVDVRYIATLSRKSIGGININSANTYSNGLFDALKTVRMGGDSTLMDALIPANALVAGAGNGSSQLRSGSFSGVWSLAMGDFNSVINTLATTNGTYNLPSGVNGGVLRAGCLPSQYNGTTCLSHNVPENFIYTNPQFASATINSNLGHSNYHSMQAQVTMRPTRGLSFQTTYTWSRNLSDQGLTDYRQGSAREFYLDGQHRSHALSGYGTFDLPFGANGFIFRNATGAFKKAVEGWQLSWITSLTSGLPGSMTNGALFGAPRLWGATNVQAVNPQLFNPKSGKVQWANKAAQGYYFGNNKYINIPDPQCADTTLVAGSLNFYCAYKGFGLGALALDTNHDGAYQAATDPIVFDNSVPGVKGNYGLNNISGPGRWSLDLAMSKSIEFMEGKKIDFRIDGQDILNHATPSGTAAYAWNARFTQIYNPNFAMNGYGTNFGQMVSKGNHRTFQAKIRISF